MHERTPGGERCPHVLVTVRVDWIKKLSVQDVELVKISMDVRGRSSIYRDIF